MALNLEKFVPTLVIGIGGTGSKIIYQLLQNIKDEDRIKTLEENNLFEFVAMDTDLGELENLAIRNKIRTSENLILADYIRIRRREDSERNTTSLNWMPSEKKFPKAFFDFDISSGAGQIRLYSRLAMEKASNQIYSSLKSSIARLESINNQGTATKATNINVYIVCSMAGGTGAGSFLQIAAMVKYILNANNKQGNVKAYIISPDIYTQGGILPHNQLSDIKANAYAVLKELDAFYKLMARKQGFGLFTEEDMEFIFSPSLKITSHADFRNTPVDFAYLIDATNESGSLTVDKGVMFKLYERMVADALYASIFSPISSKAASVENNTIRMKLESSKKETDYPGYGALGAGRLVFPVEDIANYLGHRFVSDVICQNWKTMDADYHALLREYDKAKQMGEEKPYPFRHEKYIQYVNGKHSEERAPAEVKIAYNLYKKLEKDKESFSHGVDAYIAKNRFTQFCKELNLTGEKEDLFEFDEVDEMILPPPDLNKSLDTHINGIQAVDSPFNYINEQIEIYTGNVQKLRSAFQRNSNGLESSIISEILSDDSRTRSDPDKIAPHKLIKWLTIDSKKEGMNIFFIRYFFSRQLDEFFTLYEKSKSKIEEYKQEIDGIEKYLKQEDPGAKLQKATSLISWKHPIKSLKNIFFKKSVYLEFMNGEGDFNKSFDSYTDKYFKLVTNLCYQELRNSVLKKIIGLLSYQYRGKDFANENGFLEIIHNTFDYVSNTLEEEFQRETEKLAGYSPSVEKMGVTRGVYHNKQAKENIWNNIGAHSGGSVAKINETYQKMLDGIETSWRGIYDLLGTIDRDMLKIRRQTILKNMTNNFKDSLLTPSRDYFKIALNEKYNILSAMKEEYEMHGVYEESEIEKRILDELKKLFDDCSPFAKTMDVSSVQSIATIAYAEELKTQKIEKYIGLISNESGTGNVDTLSNKQIILILRARVGYTIKDFKTIPEYFESYLQSSLTRHIDYRWDYQLPETSTEQEAFFGRLLMRAQTEGVIRFVNGEKERQDGKMEYCPEFYELKNLSGGGGPKYLHLGSSFKESYFMFKRLMKENQSLRFQILDSHKLARDLDFSGANTKYSESIEALIQEYMSIANSVSPERKAVIDEIRKLIDHVYRDEFQHVVARKESQRNNQQS